MINFLLGGVAPVGEGAASIADILTQAGLLFTWVFQNLATVVTTITSNPLLLFGFLITLTGLVVGIFKRLTNIA